MKQYLLTAAKMKQCDENTTVKFKMPSLLLMERAALATVEELQRQAGQEPCRVLVAAGSGNNGGDGLAIGRLLMLKGYQVDFCLLGNIEKCSKETRRQIEILKEYGAAFFDRIEKNEYLIVIDAVFGIGLSRAVEGKYREAVQKINDMHAYVCSVDIPSGVNADDGRIMGCCVQADLTVTYGFYKIGQMLYPGAEHCGRLICRDIGIDTHGFLGQKPFWYTYLGAEGVPFQRRRADGNKGTFGKALLIAGSSSVYGAAFLAAKSCFKTGAGMVRIVTAKENREALQKCIPEAMLTVYGEDMAQEEKEGFAASFKRGLDWADCILIGPGIGTEELARQMLKECIADSSLPLVIDADGLNILAEDEKLQECLLKQQERTVVLTPHLGEFARLYGCSVPQVKENITEYPVTLSKRLHCIVVCKDARTPVAGCGRSDGYLNTTGNDGMATAGSGDVLAGMIAALLAQGMTGWDSAVTGTFLHGTAGDFAADKMTRHAMMAADIIDEIGNAIETVLQG